jgi:hypothetical protein
LKAFYIFYNTKAEIRVYDKEKHHPGVKQTEVAFDFKSAGKIEMNLAAASVV